MTNKAIAQRILDVIDAYESGSTSASAVAESVELHEPALEAITRDVRDSLHNLSVKVIEQDVSSVEEEQLGIRNSKEALKKLKKLLSEMQ